MIKEALGPEDQHKVWRATEELSFLHYAHDEASGWRVYPVDPRNHPHVISVPSRAVDADGKVRIRGGFEEVL